MVGRSLVEIYRPTSNEEFIKVFRRALKIKVIVVVAKCEIFYEGRAASYAEPHTRLIIVKTDGTVLVHERDGREPLNWQPSNSIISITEEDGNVVIISKRIRPPEVLKIVLHEIYALMTTHLSKTKLRVLGTEEDMVRQVALNPSIIEEGATLVSREVSTPHGRIDLVLRSKDGYLIVTEFKRSTADIDAVYQLRRYVEYYSKFHVNVRGVLVAPSISPRAQALLKKWGFKFVKMSPPIK